MLVTLRYKPLLFDLPLALLLTCTTSQFLEKARAMGTFLLVGIYNDSLVNKQRGGGFPVLNLHERALRYTVKHIQTHTNNKFDDLNVCFLLLSRL